MRFAATVVLVMVLLLNLQCINADSLTSTNTSQFSKEAPRAKRGAKKERFLRGPDGQKSVLADKFDPDKQYKHVDANGQCCCGLCNPGLYVKTFCMCAADSVFSLEPQKRTDCTHVDMGTEFMDKPNNSTVPYTCTETCKVNQTKTSDCTSTADITCECQQGWFNPNNLDDSNIPKECRKVPGCKAGEEPIKQVSDDVVMYSCQQCQPGYFKREGNSTKACEPHRVCQTIPGSLTSDVRCLNDDLLQRFLSGRTQVPSTPAPPTQWSSVDVATTLPRLSDKMQTSPQPDIDSGVSIPPDERRPHTTTGEKDHQPPTPPIEATGKPVLQFRFDVAFYVTSFLLVVCIVIILTLSIVMYNFMVCKSAQKQGPILPVSYSQVKQGTESDVPEDK